MQRIAMLSLVLLLLSGCHKIYSQFCMEQEKIDCLRAVDDLSEGILKQYLPGVESSDCPYLYKVSHYEVTACNNPKANAIGSDFDGYVRMEVFLEGQCYYRIQQDYKAGGWQSLLPGLTEQMEAELLLP